MRGRVALHAAALVAVLRLSDDEQQRGDEPYAALADEAVNVGATPPPRARAFESWHRAARLSALPIPVRARRIFDVRVFDS